MKFAILFAALTLRFYALDLKPPHFDEGINGFFVQQMWRTGFFRYDPTNYHGPFFFYLLQLAELSFGWGIWSFRAVTAATSVGCVASIFLFAPWIGRRASLVAAVVLAVSPAFTFYGRYAIHESLFVLGQILFVYAILRYRTLGGARSAWWLAGGFFLLASNKETFIILLAVCAIAWAMASLAERVPWLATQESPLRLERAPIQRSIALFAVLGSVGALGAFYSGFGLNVAGISDFFAAFAAWTKTGVAKTGHEKPLLYWFELLLRYELPLVLGLLAAIALLLSGRLRSVRAPKDGSPFSRRFVALVGLGLFSAYSLVPYKTPWCLMSAAWPLALTCGIAFEDLVHRRLGGAFAAVVVACALTHSGWKAWTLNFHAFDDGSEPYVYVQTKRDFTRLEETLAKATAQNAALANMSILVLLADSWPLPWALSQYPNVTFGKVEGPDTPTADVILIDGADQAALEKQIKRAYHRTSFQLRDGIVPGFAYFAEDAFPEFQSGSAEPGASASGEGT